MLDQREQVVEESGLTRRCCERTLWQRGPNCDRVRPRNAQGCRAGGDEKGIRGRASARAPGRPTPREAWWLWGLFPPLARDGDGGPSGSTRLDPAAAIRCTPISDIAQKSRASGCGGRWGEWLHCGGGVCSSRTTAQTNETESLAQEVSCSCPTARAVLGGGPRP